MPLAITAAVLVRLGTVGAQDAAMVLMNAPGAVQELVLAGWLIVRGFRRQGVAPGSAELSHPNGP